MGVGLLDIGAGTCDLALFYGPLRHLVEIPFGGEDITRDLSMVLNISPREAEQLKLDYGAVCCHGSEGDETLTFNTTAGRTNTMTRQQLSEIIEARQQEIFEFVRDAIAATPHGQMLAAGLVLTGGGALLNNVTQLAEEVLGIPVRLGAPHDLVAPDAQQDPSFATAVGLLRFAGGDHEELGKAQAPEPVSNGFLGRLSRIFSLF
jgi:cell division protein FtsA